VEELRRWADRAPEGIEVYAAATLLHHLYSAVEAMIERSLRLFDGLIPGGANWHTRLLSEASVERAGLRPIILSENPAVDELRRFRHRFRHRYDVTLDPERLKPLIHDVLAGWDRIEGELQAFRSFVEQCVAAAQ
jgi:hypothetical protein